MVRFMPEGLVKDAGVYALFNAAAALFPFLVTLLLTRLIVPADYGLYGLILVAVTLAAPLIGLGMENAVGRRFVERTETDFPRYVSTAVVLTALSAAGVYLLSLLVRAPLSAIFPVPSAWFWAWAVAAWSQVVLTIVLTVLQMEQRPADYGKWRVLRAGGVQVLIAGIALSGYVTWQALVLGLALANAALAGVCLRWLWQRGYLTAAFSRTDANAVLTYGIPLVPHMLATALLLAIGPFLLANMKGSEAVGVFTVGLTLSQVMSMLGGAVNRAWTPWFFRRMKEGGAESRLAILRGGGALALALALAGASLAVIGWIALPPIVGGAYQSAAGVFVWLVGAWTVHNILGLVSAYFYFTHRTAWISAITLAAVAINASLSPRLIETGGAAGAAQAVCLSYVIALVLAGIAVFAHSKRERMLHLGSR